MKRSVALLISAVSIVAMAFVVLHHSEKSLELAGLAVERVDASGIDMSFQACNPSIVPITVEEVDGNLDSSQARYGTLAVAGKPISALSQESIEGRLNFVDFESMKSFLDLVLYDKTNPDFNATILVKEKLFGAIPYSYEKNYGPAEFSNLIFGNVPWDCKTKPNHSSDIKEQLVLAEARMNMTSLLYLDKIQLGNETSYAKNNGTIP